MIDLLELNEFGKILHSPMHASSHHVPCLRHKINSELSDFSLQCHYTAKQAVKKKNNKLGKCWLILHQILRTNIFSNARQTVKTVKRGGERVMYGAVRKSCRDFEQFYPI